MAKEKNIKSNILKIAGVILAVIAAFAGGYGLDIAIRPDKEAGTTVVETKFSMELAQESVPAIVTKEDGTEETVEVPTVENIDSEQKIDETEFGRGWYVPTETPQAFMNATYGQCIDVDGHFGSQCFDLGNLFWQNYAGRDLSSCGTGAAKGTLNCWDYNAGSDFDMIWNPEELQAGDWVIFNGGEWGHIGMAMGGYNNGYVSLYGTNQGGAACLGGGSTSNIININLKNFAGAFRPKAYIIPEPTPETPDTGIVK